MARELTIKITAEGSQATRELGKVEQSIQGVTDQTAKAEEATKRVGAAIAAAFTALKLNEAVQQSLQLTSQINDLSERLGIGAEAVQRLKFAFEQSGSSIEVAATAIGRMSDVLGGDGAGDALAKFGLKLEDIAGLSMDQVFVAISEAARKMEDPFKQADALTTMFGRTSLQMLPAIKAGIKEVGEQAPIMSADVVKAGDEAGDKIAKMHQQMDNLKAQALLPLVEGFTKFPESVQMAAAGIFTFLPSIEQLLLAILAVGGPGKALALLTGAITTAGTTLVTWAGAIGTFLTGAGAALVTFFTTTLPAAFTATIAFLGPQGLIAIAILALVAIWLKWGDDITRIVKRVYEAIKEWLVDKFNAVVDAVGKKVKQVTDFFGDMYDKVVGNSFVPDMIDEIGQHFGRLDSVMTNPTKAATDFITDCFGGMTASVDSMLDDWIGGLGGKFGGIGDLVSGALGNVLGGLTGSLGGLITGGIGAAVNHFRGGEEALVVNPKRDAFLLQFGPPGTGPESGFQKLAELMHSYGRKDLFDILISRNKYDEFQNAEHLIIDLLGRHGFEGIRAFHRGGLVPGMGDMPALLQGGEGVLSRRGMSALDKLNEGASPDGWATVAQEVSALRRDLGGLDRKIGWAMRDAVGKLRPRMA